MGVNSLPKTVTRRRRGCDLNPGPTAPESSTLNTLPLSHVSMPHISVIGHCIQTLLPGCIQSYLQIAMCLPDQLPHLDIGMYLEWDWF